MLLLDPPSLIKKISMLQGGQRTAIKTELVKSCSRYATAVKRGKYFKKLWKVSIDIQCSKYATMDDIGLKERVYCLVRSHSITNSNFWCGNSIWIKALFRRLVVWWWGAVLCPRSTLTLLVYKKWLYIFKKALNWIHIILSRYYISIHSVTK